MQRRSSCDLFECIEQHSRLGEETAKYVFAQIVEVVWALGKMGICHRDIKDENFVVSADFKVRFSLVFRVSEALELTLNRSQVKLIDFGSAVIFDPRNPAPFYTRSSLPLLSLLPALTLLPRLLRHHVLRLCRNPSRRSLPSSRIGSLVPRNPPLDPRHWRMPFRRRQRRASWEDLETENEVGW